MVDTASAFGNTAAIQPPIQVQQTPPSQQQPAPPEHPAQAAPTQATAAPQVDESKLDLSSVAPVGTKVDESSLDLSSVQPVQQEQPKEDDHTSFGDEIRNEIPAAPDWMTPDPNSKLGQVATSIAQDEPPAFVKAGHDALKGLGDLKKMMDDPRHPMTPEALSILTLLSPAAGAGAKVGTDLSEVNAQQSLQDRIAGLQDRANTAATGMTAPPAGDISKDMMNLPIKQFENVSGPTKDVIPMGGVKEDVAELQATEQKIAQLQKIGSQDAAGKAQLDELNQRAEQLRARLVGSPKEPVPETPPTLAQAMASKAEQPDTGHPTRNSFEEAQQDAANRASIKSGSSEEQRRGSDAYFDEVRNSTEPLPQELSGKILDQLRLKSTGRAASDSKAAADPVNTYLDDLESRGMRNQSLNMGEVKIMDEKLGDIINGNLTPKGVPTALGQRAMQAQDKLRDLVHDAPGNDTLIQARKIWEQGAKMRDVERMQEFANLTKNPATAMQSQIRTYLTSKRSRGLDPDERTSLEQAAKDGHAETALHVLGNRLGPLIAGGAEMGTGSLTGGLAGAAAAHMVGTSARAANAYIKNSKLNKAKDLIRSKSPLLTNGGTEP